MVTNPTKSMIEDKMREYARKSYSQMDQLLIFFAGHGDKDPDFNTGYFVPVNANEYREYVSHANFLAMADRIPSNHTLVIADACYSGLFAEVDLGQRSSSEAKRGTILYKDKSNEDFLRDEMGKRSRLFIASGADVVPDGIKGNNTPFMRKILEAFEGDLGGDIFLEYGELSSEVKKVNISNAISGSFGSNQPGSNFFFILKR